MLLITSLHFSTGRERYTWLPDFRVVVYTLSNSEYIFIFSLQDGSYVFYPAEWISIKLAVSV